MSLLEMRHLDTMIALAETGSLTRASKRVHLSQSALSHQLKALEDHYGGELFVRKTSPIQWTRLGERLLGLAYDVRRSVNDAEREMSKIQQGVAGQLRIAVECHSCFDWLMPSMDLFREAWPEVEMDLISGFHADPGGLLDEGRADLVIISQKSRRKMTDYFPLFQFEMPLLLAHDHPLNDKDYVTARDFEMENLITYPIPEERMDIFRKVLRPAGVQPRSQRRTELTVAILQLVASRRGVSVLPRWAVATYLDSGYINEKKITSSGLTSELYAAVRRESTSQPYMVDFVQMMKSTMAQMFKDVEILD
ncbi:LysR family transcriptional regulator [Persicirhabdus sediminis]|uniref:HTH-type transcriptional regulator MetR n=1 Tax=Persicirhabdus sediminis TaxID=454144 RepID=A0A8J7SJ24_9BACT|nr:LysR family transcriptional regulator [Persicirhabdus sediminis]MBK1791850.1 LysR family transcriptional regulator [Persicirhabdus sediminis]